MKKALQKILFVDDDENLHLIAKICLQSYSVQYAKSGKEAIAMAANFQPDLILLDLLMPEMDGAETLKVLKSDPKTASISVALFTVKKEEAEQYAKDIIGIIAKPFNPLTFASMVKKLWES